MNGSTLLLPLALALTTLQPAQRSAQQHPAATLPPASAAPSSAPGGLTAAQIVANVQLFYDRTNDFEADFTIRPWNQLSGLGTTRSGHVRFRKPGRMRWDYTTPPGDVIVSDGTVLWTYEAAARQATRSSLAGSQLPSALSFLTGTGRLSQDFNATLLNPATYNYAAGYVVQLTPVRPSAGFEHVVFFVEPANFQVVRFALFDAQGNRQTIDLTSPQANTNPALTLFQWNPPSGTQVVRP